MNADDQAQGNKELVFLLSNTRDNFTFLGLNAEMRISTFVCFYETFHLRHSVVYADVTVYIAVKNSNSGNITCCVRGWIAIMYHCLCLHYRNISG
jgi:hypothetical protein